MTRRDDYLEAFWIDPDYQGLGGVPDEAEQEVPQRSDPTEAVLFLRDRVGFKYHRVVKLKDFMSQREAAQLLRLPVMTINRWVRAKKLPSRKRKGRSIIRFRDVVRVAKDHGRAVPMKSRLAVQRDGLELNWIPTGARWP